MHTGKSRKCIPLVAVLLVLVGCSTPDARRLNRTPEFHPVSAMLQVYDQNHDGTITKAEVENGLRAEFARADIKHVGCLDPDEARIVNQQRWDRDQSTYSPVLDLKGTGCIDFDEFASTIRSLFDQMDVNADGKITGAELQPRQGAPPSH